MVDRIFVFEVGRDENLKFPCKVDMELKLVIEQKVKKSVTQFYPLYFFIV